MRYLLRDPNKGYYGRQLWLPKCKVNTASVKAGLEFPVVDKEGFSYLQLWEDVGDHLVVPREFIPRGDLWKLSFPVVDALPPPPEKVVFNSRIVLDAKRPDLTIQRDAAAAMIRSKGGLLNLACGRGKTVLALHLIATRQVPTLVIVNNTTLIDQWCMRIADFLDVPGGVGIVQGPPSKWDWGGRGICVAMIHSLGLRHDQLPEGFDRYFGLVIYDECHHISAPLFLPTAPLFYGERHGLTATVRREDGLEAMYQYHLGQVYFRDLSQELKTRIYFQISNYTLDLQDPEVVEAISDKNGKLNIPRLRNYVGTRHECNEFIHELIQKAVGFGRKVLALSHSVEQLRQLAGMTNDAGLCTGDDPPADRITALRTRRVCFGTLQLVKEALDEDTLDTMFFLTPFGSAEIEEGGFNTLQQGMGRLQRPREGKKTPVVVFLDYALIPKLHKMCNVLRKQLRNWPADQGGPLEYTTLRPNAKGNLK